MVEGAVWGDQRRFQWNQHIEHFQERKHEIFRIPYSEYPLCQVNVSSVGWNDIDDNNIPVIWVFPWIRMHHFCGYIFFAFNQTAY